MKIDIEETVGASVVRPGDTLVVCVPGRISADYALRLKSQIEERLPGCPVVVLTEVGQVLTYRPEGS